MTTLIIAFAPWGLGLTLFSVLWTLERFSARRHRKRLDHRLSELTRSNGHSPYGRTFPNIPKPQKPYQKSVR